MPVNRGNHGEKDANRKLETSGEDKAGAIGSGGVREARPSRFVEVQGHG